MSKMIGILGGMGPLATIDLFQKIVLNTPAQSDQDHLRVLIYNNPKIPPRILALNEGPDSPLPGLIESAVTLERAGADFLIMPCHSAHFWFNELKKAVSIPFYSIIDNTVQTIIEQQRYNGKKLLLLASEITAKSRLYQKAFENSLVSIVVPNDQEQTVINQVIMGIKAGKIQNNQYLNELTGILLKYQAEGLSAVLGCCTEIPLIFPYLQAAVELLDPTLMLAKAAIEKAALPLNG